MVIWYATEAIKRGAAAAVVALQDISVCVYPSVKPESVFEFTLNSSNMNQVRRKAAQGLNSPYNTSL